MVRDQAPTVCFLMETRLDKEGFMHHCRELAYPNKLIVKKLDSDGRLALVWKEEVRLEVINYTDNHVLAKVVEENGFQWFDRVLWLTGSKSKTQVMGSLKAYFFVCRWPVELCWRF